jgi:hypothetical protein
MKVYLKKNGLYVGADPAAPDVVYADRTAGGGWEQIEMTPHDQGQFDLLLVAANRQLSFTPTGLETRAAAAVGAWELPYATSQPDGAAFCYRLDAGVIVGGGVYTLEAAA